MAIDERKRHQLHSRLEEVLGADEAATLMELLPRVPWRDAMRAPDLPTARRDIDPRATGRSDSAIRPPASLGAGWNREPSIVADRGAATSVAIAEPPADRHDRGGTEESSEDWTPEDRFLGHMDRAFNDFRAELQRELRIQGYLLIGGVAVIYALITVIVHSAN